MTETSPRTVAIVGAGASGVILACHLMKASPRMRVTLIDPAGKPGRGLAYGTRLPEHRLNVAANRMSAFVDDPLHFWNWYKQAKGGPNEGPNQFLARRDYGDYLTTLFDEASKAASDHAGLRHLQAECLEIRTAGTGVELRLSTGASLAAQICVLATGHDWRAPQSLAVARAGGSLSSIDPNARVIILGSGLSMVDAWLELEAAGHKGEIVAVSRRGLFPQPHGMRRNPVQLDTADIPLGTELSYFVRWFSDLIDDVRHAGGDWRDVIDGIRPFNQRIWRDWPISAKRRFLEHAKAWWDVHRHRIAPDIYARAQKAIGDGRLRLIAGKITEARAREDRSVTLAVRPRGTRDSLTLEGACVLDCTGLVTDPARSGSPLIRSLLDSGLSRPDPLRISLDVTGECRLVDADGHASDRLFAVGPLTRGQFFEIDAVPEIREQCASLALRLAGTGGSQRSGP